MKKVIYLFIYLCVYSYTFSQDKKETGYLFFDKKSKEKCKVFTEQTARNKKGIEFVKKYTKKERDDQVTFFICQESFVLDKKQKIDTCSVSFLKKIKFETLESIEKKRSKAKNVSFFKNSVFDKLYLIEVFEDKMIKYPVIWNTDLIEK